MREVKKLWFLLLTSFAALLLQGCAVESTKGHGETSSEQIKVVNADNDFSSHREPARVVPHGDIASVSRDGIAEGDARTVQQLEHAAVRGDATAQLQLGRLFLNGSVVRRSDDEARKWFLLAAEKGQVEAQYAMGQLYMSVPGTAIDYASAVMWFRKASDQGFAPAQLRLGWMYVNGQGVQTDVNAALRLFKQAAEGGDLEAQKAIEFAFKFADEEVQYSFGLHEAAAKGSAQAQRRLARMFDFGDESNPPRAEAIKWYRLAAEQGDMESQRALGRIFKKHDTREALKWYTLSANQDDVMSQVALGTLYYQGVNGFRDYRQAGQWYRLASKNGSMAARTELGDMYRKGQGLSVNLVAAYALYFAATPKTNDIENQLAAFHPLVESEMSSAEIEAAKELAQEMLKPDNFLSALDGSSRFSTQPTGVYRAP